MLRIALNAGWVLDEAEGNATTWFDYISIIPQQKYPNAILLNANESAYTFMNIKRLWLGPMMFDILLPCALISGGIINSEMSNRAPTHAMKDNANQPYFFLKYNTGIAK